MVRERFDGSFERLRDQSNHLADIERTPDNLDEIVAERVELDARRAEATAARKEIVSRFEPPAPEVVEPPRGRRDTRLFGKIAAAVAGVLLVGIGFGVYRVVRSLFDGYPLYIDSISETIEAENGCVWTVDAVLRNDGERAVRVRWATTRINGEVRRADAPSLPTIGPGQLAPVQLEWSLGPAEGCTDLDGLRHGNLVIQLDAGTSVSRSF